MSGEVLNIFKGHTAGVKSVAFSPDGTKIVSGSGDFFNADYSVRVCAIM